MIVENTLESDEEIIERIKNLGTLDKLERPKKVYILNKFPETNNGKIQRKKTIKAVIG